jgi:AcrR family transcriptional regulator
MYQQLRDVALGHDYRAEEGSDQPQIGAAHEAAMQSDPAADRRPGAQGQGEEGECRQPVDPAEVTGGELLDEERAQHRPVHGHDPHPADEAMGAIAARSSQQLPATQGQCEGGAEGVDSDESAHNTVIVPSVGMDKPDLVTATDDVTRRLVDEAGRLLVEHGIDGLSLRKLAAAAGTSTMSVYTRFGSKQQLLAAMHREGFDRLGAALADAARSGAGPLQVLGEIGRAYRRAALTSPTLYGLMFGPPTPGLDPSPEDATAAEATYRPLVDAVRRCIDAHVLAGDPERIALHLWGVVHGMVSLELAGRLHPGTSTRDQAYEEALVLAAHPFMTMPAGDIGA